LDHHPAACLDERLRRAGGRRDPEGIRSGVRRSLHLRAEAEDLEVLLGRFHQEGFAEDRFRLGRLGNHLPRELLGLGASTWPSPRRTPSRPSTSCRWRRRSPCWWSWWAASPPPTTSSWSSPSTSR